MSARLLPGIAILLGVGFAALPDSDRGELAHAVVSPPEERAGGAGPYDPNPSHPWNRVHRALFVRTGSGGREYGLDELDPPLWPETRHLTTDPSRSRAVEALDAFLAENAETRVEDPLKRALFQRDLWAVFDWLARGNETERPVQTELGKRIARVIRRVALSPERIRALPDNYAAAVGSGAFTAKPAEASSRTPFLPPDLLQHDSSWVLLGERGINPIALNHTYQVDGRSVFFVYVRLPGGRKETLEYFEKLRSFPDPVTRIDGVRRRFNPNLPQFPAGTAVALVRQMLLIDDRGRLAPTRLTESIQFRVFRSVSTYTLPSGGIADFSGPQEVSEFVLNRAKLFAGETGGLRAIGREEKELARFFTHGVDPLEKWPAAEGEVTLRRCGGCHDHPGIFSVNSYTKISTGPGTIFLVEPRELPLDPVPGDLERDRQAAVAWKQGRASWGFLEGLLATLPR